MNNKFSNNTTNQKFGVNNNFKRSHSLKLIQQTKVFNAFKSSDHTNPYTFIPHVDVPTFNDDDSTKTNNDNDISFDDAYYYSDNDHKYDDNPMHKKTDLSIPIISLNDTYKYDDSKDKYYENNMRKKPALTKAKTDRYAQFIKVNWK